MRTGALVVVVVAAVCVCVCVCVFAHCAYTDSRVSTVMKTKRRGRRMMLMNVRIDHSEELTLQSHVEYDDDDDNSNENEEEEEEEEALSACV